MIENLVTLLDAILPGRHALALTLAAVLALGGGVLLWLVGLRFQWRKDQRETSDSVSVLMVRLVDQQRAELERLVGDIDIMRKQIELFAEGRWQLQRAVDELRDHLIAARVMIHDYERRLGLDETAFPTMPALPVLGKV